MKNKKPEGTKIHISLDKDMHKLLRVKCALEDVTLQKYVVDLLKNSVKDLVIKNRSGLTIVQGTKNESR